MFVNRRGVATASIKLSLLSLTQCPQPFYVPNAFKNTALCDYESTYVRTCLYSHTRLTHSHSSAVLVRVGV